MSAEQFARALERFKAGRHEEARAALEVALRKDPINADTNGLMAITLARLGQQRQGLFYIQRALIARPDDPMLLTNMGQLHSELKEWAPACAAFERVLAAQPKDLQARLNLCSALLSQHRCAEAERHARVALELAPENGTAACALGVALASQMRAEEGCGVVRRAATVNRRDPTASSMWAFLTNYCSEITPEDSFQAHKAFGDLLATAPPPPGAGEPTGSLDPERRLNVGFIGGDFVTHSVAFFLEPLLERLDRERVRSHCYHTAITVDAMTDRIRSVADVFRHIAFLDRGSLWHQVRADKIDVLIDVAGHTTNGRMLQMHFKAAPVQATYLGYPNTTGVRAIDWRIVDSVTDPTGSERLATERLTRLDPCFLCWRPPAEAPAVCGRAAGPVTFGSFNAPIKLNQRVVRAWARVLAGAPGSRLLLKGRGFDEQAYRETLAARMAEAGIDPARVELAPPTASIAEHLGAYARIGVALDPFPYNGTTTTCEALYMGVPVVTLLGRAHAGRVGASLLAAMGRREWIAQDEDAYVRIALELTNSAPDRSGLRAEVERSPWRDEAGYARRFEGVVREMWRGFCAARAGRA